MTRTTRAAWDEQVDAEYRALVRPAVAALGQVAGEIDSWKYAAIHALLAELATEAAHAKVELRLGPQPGLPPR